MDGILLQQACKKNLTKLKIGILDIKHEDFPEFFRNYLNDCSLPFPTLLPWNLMCKEVPQTVLYRINFEKNAD